MSAESAALGVLPTLSFGGVEYRVGQRDFEIEAMLANRLERNALEAVQRFRGSLTQPEYAMLLDGWRRDVAARLYAYGSPAFIAWAVTPEGMKHEAFLRLAKANAPGAQGFAGGQGQPVTPELIDRIWDDEGGGWERLVEAMNQADADPTRTQTT